MLAINTNQIAPNNGAQDLAIIKAIDRVERKEKDEKVQPQDGGEKVNISKQGKDFAQAEAADQAAKKKAPKEAAVDGKKSSKKVEVKDTAAVEGKDNAVAAEKLETARNEIKSLVTEIKSLGVDEQDVEKAFSKGAVEFKAKFGRKIDKAVDEFRKGKIDSSQFFFLKEKIDSTQFFTTLSNKIIIGGPAIGGPMNSAKGAAVHTADRSGETKMMHPMVGIGRSNLFSPGPAVGPMAAISAYKMGMQNPFGSV